MIRTLIPGPIFVKASSRKILKKSELILVGVGRKEVKM
jgi:hypothetical protein